MLHVTLAVCLSAAVSLALAADAPVATVRLAEAPHGTRELADVVSQIREQAAIDVLVDARHEHDLVVVPGGQYAPSDLVAAVGLAAGLRVRRIGDLVFLAETVEGRAALTAELPLAQRIELEAQGTARLLGVASHLVRGFDFADYDLPFSPDDFLDSKRMRFDTLPPLQRELLLSHARDSTGAPIEFTDASIVRLFPAFQVLLGSFAPASPPLWPEGLRGSPESQEESRRRWEGRFLAARTHCYTVW